jgi:hypothetical protein
MRLLAKMTVGVALSAGVLAGSTAIAPAAVACRGDVCWHTSERYDYPPEARIIIHPDGWHWRAHERFRWREHEGRGYWDRGSWREW